MASGDEPRDGVLHGLSAPAPPHARARAGVLPALAPLALVGLVLVLAGRVGEVFPPTWSDEAHFLIPSAPWGTGRTFDATGMLKPEGVYWLPLGYYAFNATLFSVLGGASLEVARYGSLLCTLLGALLVLALHRKALPAAPAPHAPWFAALWLASPPIVIAGHVARPDALVLTLGLLGTLAALSGRGFTSVACGVTAACVHPLVSLPALTAAAVSPLAPSAGTAYKRREWLLAVVAVALCVGEAYRLIVHHDAYLADFRYQLGRKLSRELAPTTVALAVGLAAGVLVALAAAYRRGRGLGLPAAQGRALALALVGLGCVVVQSYGQEMWYAAARLTGVALLLLAASAAFGGARASAVSLATMLLLVAANWYRGFSKELVQGIPLPRAGMREAVEEKRAIERALAKALARPSTAATMVSPFLSAPFVARLQRAELYAVSGLSHPEVRTFDRVAYIEQAYPAFLNDHETLEALAGYRCVASERLRSPGGLYEVVIGTIERRHPSTSEIAMPRCEAPQPKAAR